MAIELGTNVAPNGAFAIVRPLHLADSIGNQLSDDQLTLGYDTFNKIKIKNDWVEYGPMLDDEEFKFGTDEDFAFGFDGTDFKLRAGTDEVFTVNSDRVLILPTLTNPTAVAGGIYYNGTDFYLGFN